MAELEKRGAELEKRGAVTEAALAHLLKMSVSDIEKQLPDMDIVERYEVIALTLQGLWSFTHFNYLTHKEVVHYLQGTTTEFSMSIEMIQQQPPSPSMKRIP